jgi:type II secretory pathway component PulL
VGEPSTAVARVKVLTLFQEPREHDAADAQPKNIFLTVAPEKKKISSGLRQDLIH